MWRSGWESLFQFTISASGRISWYTVSYLILLFGRIGYFHLFSVEQQLEVPVCVGRDEIMHGVWNRYWWRTSLKDRFQHIRMNHDWSILPIHPSTSDWSEMSIHAAPRQGPPAPRSQGVISASVVVAPGQILYATIIQKPCILRNFCAFRRKNADIYDVFATSRTKLVQNTAIYSVFWWTRRKHSFLRCFCDKALKMYRKYQCFLHFYYFQLSKQTF